jgi:hypothetical protein
MRHDLSSAAAVEENWKQDSRRLVGDFEIKGETRGCEMKHYSSWSTVFWQFALGYIIGICIVVPLTLGVVCVFLLWWISKWMENILGIVILIFLPFAVGMLRAIFQIQSLISENRIRHHRCGNCGYSLIGFSGYTHKCPECGTPF